MKCCGVNGYTDFSTYATTWNRTIGSSSSEIDAPLVCCKTAPTSASDINCARNGTLDINEEVCITIYNQVHPKPPPLPAFSGVRVIRSLVLCVCFADPCLSICTFSFGHCVVCCLIYEFCLPLWYLQTLLFVKYTKNIRT